MSDWLQLPVELWVSVTDKLSFTGDKIRFRSVCKTWRSLLLLPFPQPPWLMLAEDHRNPSTRGFFGLNDHQVHQLELPEAYRTRCFGSTGTCLITIDVRENIRLLHPFSRQLIHLPHQSTFEYGLEYDSEEYENDYSFDDDDDDDDYNERRDSLLKKVVLSSSPFSSSDCIAMAIHYNDYKLAMARPGDPSWTTVQSPNDCFCDVIFYRNKFYGINGTGILMVCDLDRGVDPPTATVLSDSIKIMQYVENLYLVEWMGELLLVTRYRNARPQSYKPNRFEVCKFDLTERRWSELKDLGEYSLFLGFNTSVAILASQCHGVERNCIYFTDDFASGTVGGGRDMGVFHMEDGSVGLHYKGVSTSLYSPPLWIVPSNMNP